MAIDTKALDQLIIGRVEPHIYAFSTNTIPDYLKVGDTYRPVFERLAEWKKYFPNLEKQFEGSAKINDEVYFRDLSVHDYLEKIKGRRRLLPADLGDGIYYSKEFFKDATPADVGEAIEDIRGDYSARSQRYQFYNAQNRLPETQTYARTEDYPPRPNQAEVIENFKNAVKNGRTNLLMYAVMRFGKSFTAMCCAVEMGAKLVVVVSAKADVKLEWKKTVESHKKFEDYVFLSGDALKEEGIISKTFGEGKKVVCFLTLQDLQGEEIKQKHKEIFENLIDLLLVDESHYGARAQEYGKVLQGSEYKKDIKYAGDQDDFVETEEADKIVKVLKAKVTIHLSGTPYRILMGSEFKKEDIIAFFQFTDIVKAKKEWDDEHILNDTCNEWDNPYFGFPQMVRFAFNPSESARKRLEELKKNGITYAFSALFEPCSIKKDKDRLHKKFKYEQEVLELFEVIDGSKDDGELFGFLNYDKIKQGNMCKHIVIVLPYCASCDALEQLIKDNRDHFKNLNEYEIINISGVENNKRYKKPADVKRAISDCEQNGKRTITLTKKIQSYYARILLYSFITEDKVISLADIIASLNAENNGRIARNVGLNQSVLALINQKINKFILNKLDYKIKDLNDLSHAQNMTAEERTSVAVSKFGKLGEAIVVTPANICEQMVALLPDECLLSVVAKGTKILDIAGTAGEFSFALAERMKKLGIEQSVIANAIYTIPKSKLCYELIRKVYQMSGLNVSNIAEHIEAIHLFDKKIYPDLLQESLIKIITQNKPFHQINLTDEPQEGVQKVKFEAVVGNPPYQEIVSKNEGNKSLGKQLFPLFIQLATALSEQYVILITPSKWFTSEGQDGSFLKLREFAKNNNHFKSIRIFSDNADIFDDVLLGSVNYFLYDKSYSGDTLFITDTTNQERPLFEQGLDVILPYEQMVGIVNKVRKHPQFVSLVNYTCGRDAFGISGKKESLEESTSSAPFFGAVAVRCAHEQIRYIDKNKIRKNIELVGKWKIFTSKGNGAAGTIEFDKPNAIIGKAYVAAPDTACSDSLIPIGAFDTQTEAENLAKYMSTRFLRFMVGAMKTSRNIYQVVYRFVPLQDFTEHSDIDWSKSIAEIDQKLFDKYQLSPEECEFIRKTIKSME